MIRIHVEVDGAASEKLFLALVTRIVRPEDAEIVAEVTRLDEPTQSLEAAVAANTNP